MRIVRTILAFFWAGTVALLLSIPLLLITWAFRSPKILFFCAKSVIKTSFRIVGVKTLLAGSEGIHFPDSFVLIANHLSNLDGPLLFSILSADLRVLIKKETRRIPLVGWLMESAGFIFIDRKKHGLRSHVSSEAVQRILEKRCPFMVFPEGTRSKDGKLKPFKKGGFLIAVRAGVPILPVRISGTRTLMPPRSLWIRPGTVKIEFFPLVSTQGRTEQSIPQLIHEIEKIYCEEKTHAADESKKNL